MSIVILRPALIVIPRLINAPDNHPPNTEPTSAIR